MVPFAKINMSGGYELSMIFQYTVRIGHLKYCIGLFNVSLKNAVCSLEFPVTNPVASASGI